MLCSFKLLGFLNLKKRWRKHNVYRHKELRLNNSFRKHNRKGADIIPLQPCLHDLKCESHIGFNRSLSVLWKAQEQWEPKDELGSEAVEIAELKETKPSRTCRQITPELNYKLSSKVKTCNLEEIANISNPNLSTQQCMQRRCSTELQRWVQVLMQRQLQIFLEDGGSKA